MAQSANRKSLLNPTCLMQVPAGDSLLDNYSDDHTCTRWLPSELLSLACRTIITKLFSQIRPSFGYCSDKWASAGLIGSIKRALKVPAPALVSALRT